MTLGNPTQQLAWRQWIALWPGWRPGWFFGAFLLLASVALVLRLLELDGRTMHYDEAIHVHFAWKLSQGKEFIHSPWMHGPFQVELTALIFAILGDTEFTARLAYVLFGTALVGLPYFLRDHIGRTGAVIASVMLTLSPSLLYFSRFGRNDILMAFFATALLILMWRYLHEGKDRYLYWSAAVLAFMFASKETAYMIVLIYGGIMFLLAAPELAPTALGRIRLPQLTGPAGFFLLLITLTLPQWMAITGLAQDALGLTLTNPNGISQGIIGAPHWGSPFIALPVYQADWWFHGLSAAILLGVLGILNRRPSPRAAMGIAVPLVSLAATVVILFRPIAASSPIDVAVMGDLAITVIMIGMGVAAMVALKYQWKRGVLLVSVPVVAGSIYLSVFTPVIDVSSVLHDVLPTGINVDANANGIPVNFLVAGGLLLGSLAISAYLGVRWLGARWLYCAGIFYFIWTTLYTTIFSNIAGIFSGSWLGMGYWIAQQDVARGNQPWYYYFVGLSVYELLPAVFGIAGAIYFLKKGDVFGLVLAAWAALTFMAYTLASEKMPWLLVNVTLPFILLSGKYLGDLVERVRWRDILRRGQVLLLVLPSAVVVSAVFLVFKLVTSQGSFLGGQWMVVAVTALAALAAAYLIRTAPKPAGGALAGLGVAVLLLGFGTVAATRAAYTFDDSNKEILVYAQGSADLPVTFRKLEEKALPETPGSEPSVLVDYDMWYPFQWYVRKEQDNNTVRFNCFKAEGDEGWNSGCDPASDDTESRALLLTKAHKLSSATSLMKFQRHGPFLDLLWFPETYRRPHENRQDEGFQWGLRGIPSGKQFGEDFRYFGQAATSKEKWAKILGYMLFRDLDTDWYKSEYYSYLPK